VGTIQEETHRFAITFNRAQHAKRVQGSALDSVPGVGPKRRAALLKHYKSVKQIKASSLAELEEVVDKRTAKAVYDFFTEDK
jgi:excinuclease ABC subunit C